MYGECVFIGPVLFKFIGRRNAAPITGSPCLKARSEAPWLGRKSLFREYFRFQFTKYSGRMTPLLRSWRCHFISLALVKGLIIAQIVLGKLSIIDHYISPSVQELRCHVPAHLSPPPIDAFPNVLAKKKKNVKRIIGKAAQKEKSRSSRISRHVPPPFATNCTQTDPSSVGQITLFSIWFCILRQPRLRKQRKVSN